MNKQLINYQLEATQPVKSGPLVEQSHWSAEPFKVNSSASSSLGSTPSWLRAEPTTTLVLWIEKPYWQLIQMHCSVVHALWYWLSVKHRDDMPFFHCSTGQLLHIMRNLKRINIPLACQALDRVHLCSYKPASIDLLFNTECLDQGLAHVSFWTIQWFMAHLKQHQGCSIASLVHCLLLLLSL